MQTKTLFLLASSFVMFACDKDKGSAEVAHSAPAETAAEKATLPRTAAPADARVWITSPADGATLATPFTVEFGAEGLTIVPAGDTTDASGHHHLLVNADLPDLGLPIPADENHIHFGKGQTSTTLELAPGVYTLQLLAGDHLHIPHAPAIHSEVISITVK